MSQSILEIRDRILMLAGDETTLPQVETAETALFLDKCQTIEKSEATHYLIEHIFFKLVERWRHLGRDYYNSLIASSLYSIASTYETGNTLRMEIARTSRIYCKKAGYLVQSGLRMDLISGIIGILVHLVNTPDIPSCSAKDVMLTHAIQQLQEDNHFGFRHANGHGRVDLGVAHGLPGLLVFLAKYAEKELADIYQIMNDICEFILHTMQPASAVSTFPYYSNEPTCSRLAWCYGDISILLAVSACGRRGFGGTAANEIIQITSDRLYRRGDIAGRITDPYFCHGAIGVAACLNRIANWTENEKLDSLAEFWSDQYFTKFRKDMLDSATDCTLLNGLPGVGLGLYALEFDDFGWASSVLLSNE